MTCDASVRRLTDGDAEAVLAMYEEGIATGNATFETVVPPRPDWNATHLAEHRFVACTPNHVVGWTALSPVSDRCVYSGVAENSVYVAAQARGYGVGRFLLETLVRGSEESGTWTLQTGIFRENTASIRLHQSCRFRVVGHRERLGRLEGRWRDTLFLERRSPLF